MGEGKKGKLVAPKREKGKATGPRVRTHERNETISRLSAPQPPISQGSRCSIMTHHEQESLIHATQDAGIIILMLRR